MSEDIREIEPHSSSRFPVVNSVGSINLGTAEIFDPTENVSLKDFDDAVKRVDRLKTELAQRMWGVFQNYEDWKETTGLPWRVSAEVRQFTVFFRPHIVRAEYAFQTFDKISGPSDGTKV